MNRCSRIAGLWIGVMAMTALLSAAEPPAKNLWEAAILKFEEADQVRPPAPGGIVFVGSSSIRLWDLEQSFPGLPVLNRGFGGSQLADSAHFAERIVIKYRPRLVLLYAGDNDVSGGKSPETIQADFREFVAKVHEALPETRIAYLAIKPSLARWKQVEVQRTANRLIAADCANDERLEFLDVASPLLGAEGQPRPEYYVKDGLHLSPAGYAVWNKLVAPRLK